MSRRHSYSTFVGLVGAGIAALILIRVVTIVFGGDPSGLLRVSVEGAPLLEQEIGREVPATVGGGHDGKFFFFLAIDPFIQDVDYLDERLDHNSYRAGRILYPMLASLFGVLGGKVIVWTLPAVNIVAVGLGSWALARLAVNRGMSPLFGLAFAVNLGVFFELAIDGASVVGFAFMLLGFLAIDTRRMNWAGAAFAFAVLARETMALGVVGAALYLAVGKRNRSFASKVLAVGLVPRLVWESYLRIRFAGTSDAVSATDRNFDLPFQGIFESVEFWSSSTAMNRVIIIVSLALCVAVLWKAATSPSLLSWGTAGFALLPLIASSAVLQQPFDLTRAVMPALSAALIVLIADERYVEMHSGLDPSDRIPG